MADEGRVREYMDIIARGAITAEEFMAMDLSEEEWKAAAATRTVKKHNLGSVAYHGYLAYSGGKSLVSGAVLPIWDDLPVGIQNAWMGAARAVVMNHLDTEGWAE